MTRARRKVKCWRVRVPSAIYTLIDNGGYIAAVETRPISSKAMMPGDVQQKYVPTPRAASRKKARK